MPQENSFWHLPQTEFYLPFPEPNPIQYYLLPEITQSKHQVLYLFIRQTELVKLLSNKPTSGHAYGIGVIAVIVGISISIGYYQMYYLPESLAKPKVSHEILEPIGVTKIEMIIGSASEEQKDNFVPKLVNIQLGIDNKVIWHNVDDTAHTVTPDHRAEDSYSGEFGSSGVIMPGESYEFLFTEAHVIEYHCTPHPWMKGKLEVTKQRF